MPAQLSTAGAGANGKKIFIEKSKVHPKPPTVVFGRMFPMLTTDTEIKTTVSRDFFIHHLPQTQKWPPVSLMKATTLMPVSLALIALIPRGNFAILVINACGNLPPVSTTPAVL
jgi:hypothetical protein